MKSGGWFKFAMVLVLGAIIGTLLGQITGAFLPQGAAREIFLKGASIGIKEPLQLDLAALQVSFGITLSVNPLTVIGFLLAFYLAVKLSR